jgi:hypothetical protein
VGNTPIIADGTTNSWRVSKFGQYLQTLYRTTILEFINRFLTDFGYELSNYKIEQLLPSSIIGIWWFFRATVDQLHMSNNASHIFFQCAIARFSDDIRLNMESNQTTILVLLDFSKAFDSVCHGLFILKLRQRYGFHATAAALVSSYLFPRCQKVACDYVSYLATLVFLCISLFIDDMTEVLEFSKYQMYANDLQVYHSRPMREMLFECIC